MAVSKGIASYGDIAGVEGLRVLARETGGTSTPDSRSREYDIQSNTSDAAYAHLGTTNLVFWASQAYAHNVSLTFPRFCVANSTAG